MDFDPYKTLQVDPEADPDVIQAAYRRLAQKFHPDLASDPESARRMALVNRAWELVSDPVRRAAYDRERAAATAPTSPAGAPWPASDPPGQRATGTSPNWTSGRSDVGGGYDPASMRADDRLGSAGAPPGTASGPVLTFGRYAGWSLGQVARVDLEYIEWLDRMPIGRPYRSDIDAILRAKGRRGVDAPGEQRRGLFRRR